MYRFAVPDSALSTPLSPSVEHTPPADGWFLRPVGPVGPLTAWDLRPAGWDSITDITTVNMRGVGLDDADMAYLRSALLAVPKDKVRVILAIVENLAFVKNLAIDLLIP